MASITLPDPLHSLKKRCCFRTATTSFIYPAGYQENIRRLGPYFDEIELLFLESRFAENLPDKVLTGELAQLAHEYDLTYNIHLPMDIVPNSADVITRRQDTAVLQRYIEALEPLQPTAYCLHLPFDDQPDFKERCRETLQALLHGGLTPKRLTVENLEYPLTSLQTIIEELDVGVCLDIGHTILFDTGFKEHAAAFASRIKTVHLHGANREHDHKGLDILAQNAPIVLEFLRTFRGTVSLEVFGIKELNASLAWLQPYLDTL